MSPDEQAHVLARSWPYLNLADDYSTKEAVAAITRITSGNFRLTVRLVSQIEHVMKINNKTIVTKGSRRDHPKEPRHRANTSPPPGTRDPLTPK